MTDDIGRRLEHLLARLPGPVRRIRVRHGEEEVEVEWAEGAPSAPVVAAAADTMPGEVAVTAPLVGTFYRAPQPGAPPFVEVGDAVEVGQDIAIVEAMKIMNRVAAEVAGRVTRIVAVDGEVVEYGQPLLYVDSTEA